MTVDINEFAGNDEAFALRFKREELPGLLSKKLKVPEGALALVHRDDGDDAVLAEGEETGELTAALLVKDRVRLELAFDAGRSKDNHPFQFEVALHLRPGDKVIDLGQLERSIESGPASG